METQTLNKSRHKPLAPFKPVIVHALDSRQLEDILAKHGFNFTAQHNSPTYYVYSPNYKNNVRFEMDPPPYPDHPHVARGRLVITFPIEVELREKYWELRFELACCDDICLGN